MTTENNKIIAEFMEWHYMGINTYLTPYSDAWLTNGEQTYSCPLNVMRFHSDWNWLMEVIEKIESLDINNFAKQLDREDVQPIEGKFYLSVYDCQAEFLASVYYWQHDNNIKGLKKENGNTKIQAVYNACVEFIKWYNEQNKE